MWARVDGTGGLVAYTTKAVDAGEELLANYGTGYWSQGSCPCQSCRAKAAPFDKVSTGTVGINVAVDNGKKGRRRKWDEEGWDESSSRENKSQKKEAQHRKLSKLIVSRNSGLEKVVM
ncbi:hypothetical protein PM082_010145 [Marasmius tenuissimus]|nr:hypothetical protein PM082_010145 [Marasmius tenuissimus]